MIKLLALLALSASAIGSTHFTEVYPIDAGYRVDDFVVEPGLLQRLVSSRTFLFEGEARRFAKKILEQNSGPAPSLVSTEGRGTPLWTPVNTWNESWEQKYAEWMEVNVTVDFFKKYQIAVDCADVTYALRWIFSRIHSLPAFVTLGGTGTVITHEVYREAWKNLPTHKDWNKDKRFLAALDWILDSAFTGTLLKDTYPVAINSSTIRSGLNVLMGSHAEILSRISRDEAQVPVSVMSSSVPQAVRVLTERAFMDKKGVTREKGGLMRFRWPVKNGATWKVTPKESMPFYSLEQFGKNLCADETHFALCVIKKAGLKLNADSVIRKLTKNIEDNLAFRDSVVREGHAFCLNNDCTPGTVAWEDWSTPGRDGRLFELFENTAELSKTLRRENVFTEWIRNYQKYDLPLFWKNLGRSLISNDPRDSISARWGENASGILETVSSLVRDGDLYRDEAIKSAETCRENPAVCRANPESLPLYSTLDLDFGLRKVLAGWMDYCRENTCPQNPMADRFRTIFTQSPAPWDSLAYRNGDSLMLKNSHLLLADTVMKSFPETLILNGKRLYDQKTKRESLSGIAMSFETDSLVVLTAHEIVVYDRNLKKLRSLTAPQNPQGLHSFGNGKVMALGKDQGFVFDVKTAKIVSSHQWKSYLSFEDSLLLLGNENTLLTKSETTVLSSLPGPVEVFLPYRNGEVIVVYTEGNQSAAAFWSKESHEKILEGDEGYVKVGRINSDYVIAQNQTPTRGFHPSVIYNQEKNLWRPNGYYSAGLSIAKNSRIVFEANFSSRIPYVFDGQFIRELPFAFTHRDPIVSAGQISMTTLESDGVSRIIDYDGKEISRNEDFAVGVCSSVAWKDLCADSRSGLEFSLFLRKEADPDGYLSFVRFALSGNRLAYGIRYFTGETEEDTKMKISLGSAVRIFPGVLLWNP